MILQSLNRYYEILAADPESGVALRGYSTASVSSVLVITLNGDLTDILPLFEKVQRGKKIIEVPRKLIVPEQIKRAGINPQSNFLCDNSAFVLGISKNDEFDLSFSHKRYEAFKNFHISLLKDVDCDEANALVAFLSHYNPNSAKNNPIISTNYETLLEGGNLVFKLDNRNGFVHDQPVIRRVWEKYKEESANETSGQCLITGELAPISRIHANLKGIKDSNPTGATLVGFNARAYESYGKANGQGLNSPVSEKASFAYTTALNYLLSSDNPNRKFTMGDATIVYWAESSDKTYEAVFSGLFDPDWNLSNESEVPLESHRDKKAENRLQAISEKIKHGHSLDREFIMEGLDPDTKFNVLGLSPNAARIAVRFFHQDAFKNFIDNILQHYEDMKIIKEYSFQNDMISPRRIIDETVSKKAKNKSPSPLMSGALLRSILNNSPYPAVLFNAIMIRIRGDMDDDEKKISKINYIRAAIIKAYLTRKYRMQSQSLIQEVLIMTLNENSTNQAYLLGRLFAVLEKAQQDAAGQSKLNATIKDRYFTSACAAPATVFPVLLRLSQHHLSKLQKEVNYRIKIDIRIEEILNLLDVDNNPIPSHLSLDEQGIFVLGYYHQRANFYIKKEEKNNLEEIVD